MTAPTIEQLPVRVPGRTLPHDLIHVTCCRDDDPGEIALCGTAVGGAWESKDAAPTCAVCADLDDVIYRRDNCAGICPLERGGAS